MRKTSKKRTNNKAGLIDRATVGTRLIDIRRTISELPVTPDIAKFDKSRSYKINICV